MIPIYEVHTEGLGCPALQIIYMVCYHFWEALRVTCLWQALESILVCNGCGVLPVSKVSEPNTVTFFNGTPIYD